MTLQFRGILIRRADGAIIHLDLPPIPPAIEFSGRHFTAKSEFHVTLLGREILARAGLTEFPELESAIRAAARGMRFTVELRDDLWLVTDEAVATIIRACNVDGAEEFYCRFEEQTGARFERPPYHVTLYTSGTAKGIGIATAADLERWGRKLTAAESSAFRREAGPPSS